MPQDILTPRTSPQRDEPPKRRDPDAGATSATDDGRGHDPRTQPIYQLYRQLRRLVLSLEEVGGSTETVARRLLEAVVEQAGRPGALVRGGRAYRRRDDAFELFATAGEAGPVPDGWTVPSSYAVIEALLEQGWILVRAEDPRFDPALEAPVGADVFAAVTVGPQREHFLSFTLVEPVPEEDLLVALVCLAEVADMALRQRELVAFIEQAKAIQTSLLPASPPTVPGIEVAFASRPALIVGGDAYDLHDRPRGGLTVTIGDATGHGLPAALQARDLVVGLRMAIEERLGLGRRMTHLARVLRSASTPSRFISLFHGELTADGRLGWVNGGHVPGLVARGDGRIDHLPSTGPVMGLPMTAHWRERRTRLDPGELLCLYTDGITEAKSLAGEELGQARLEGLLRDGRTLAPADLVETILTALDNFTRGSIQADDQTLVVVRRTPRRG